MGNNGLKKHLKKFLESKNCEVEFNVLKSCWRIHIFFKY